MKITRFIALFVFFAAAVCCFDTSFTSDTSADISSCPADDFECLASELFLIDEDNDHLELVTISEDLPPASTSGNVPIITKIDRQSDPMLINDVDYGFSFDIYWTDPQFSRPAFCMRPCPKTVECSVKFRCARGEPEGLVSGVFRTSLGYRVETVDGLQETDFEVYPIVTPATDSNGDGTVDTAGEEPVAVMEEAKDNGQAIADLGEETLLVGAPFTVAQEIDQPPD